MLLKHLVYSFILIEMKVKFFFFYFYFHFRNKLTNTEAKTPQCFPHPFPFGIFRKCLKSCI